MYSLLSVLVTKEPSTCAVNLYYANPKTVKDVLTTRVKGCGAFIETIADLDNAHFITKFEMLDLCGQLLNMKLTGIPRDRLVAAKQLALILSEKQRQLPNADDIVKTESGPSKCFMPQANISPPRLGTKTAMQLELLQKGTTIAEMVQVLGWKESSVHSGLNYDINHIRGFGYRVEKIEGVDFYTLIVPEWYKGPLFLPPRGSKKEQPALVPMLNSVVKEEQELMYA